jgi:Xaa-Pro aminopeptidase
VQLAPYAAGRRGAGRAAAGSVLLVDPRRITFGLRQRWPPACKVVEAINPSTLAKSRKTAAEAAFVREAMAEDGVAMCEFYAWFEAALGAASASPR